jgi:hypothetical protein
MTYRAECGWGFPTAAYLLKNTIHKELLDTIRAVHAGKKALSPEASYEIAEHATDDALTPAEINVLRLIAAGNANKQIADQLSIRGNRRGTSQEYPFKIGRQRPNAGGDDRFEERKYRAVTSLAPPSRSDPKTLKSNDLPLFGFPMRFQDSGK